MFKVAILQLIFYYELQTKVSDGAQKENKVSEHFGKLQS